jgi:hypothetical protein
MRRGIEEVKEFELCAGKEERGQNIYELSTDSLVKKMVKK